VAGAPDGVLRKLNHLGDLLLILTTLLHELDEDLLVESDMDPADFEDWRQADPFGFQEGQPLLHPKVEHEDVMKVEVLPVIVEQVLAMQEVQTPPYVADERRGPVRQGACVRI
jgi:hypothetical protein